MNVLLPELKSAMTPFPHSVDVDASMETALKVMAQHNFRHLPVTENGEIVGMLADDTLGDDLNIGAATVRNYYDNQALIVAIDEALEDVLMVMVERRLNAVVVTYDGKLEGVFTTVDACRTLAALMRAHQPYPESNTAA